MEMDADTLLQWLSSNSMKDMQEMALEQLCGALLMADNIDFIFRLLPPTKFVPALCAIFVDESATNSVLEITARAITYYFELRRDLILSLMRNEENTIRAICEMLVISPDGANKELAEQCIKVLQYVSVNGPTQGILIKFGGLKNIFVFIKNHGSFVHKDIFYSAIIAMSNCCNMIDPSDFQNQICVEGLSGLLLHEDEFVADRALNSFYRVAITYGNRCVDPVKIAEFGLLEALSTRLISATDACSTSTHETVTEANSTTIAIIFKLSSILCNYSHSITQQLLRSKFLDITEKVLQLNESTAIHLISFVNTILTLICDDRELFNETAVNLVSPEELYNIITECIHNDDLNQLIEIMETRRVDVNYVDSFGQTLMNWASAVGTPKIISFLCKKGADVNKGERASSLHYAASVGNRENVSLLLAYGANPDLKDENGKTPMDKAKERDTFSYKGVINVLLNSSTLMNTPKAEIKSAEEIKSNKEDNLQMALVYFEYLLPIFCTTLQTTTFDSVRKESLKSIKSMVRYIKSSTLEKLCKSDAVTKKFATLMTEIMLTALNDKQNTENQITMLEITESLMKKGKEIFLDAFSRFGILHQIQNLAEGYQIAEKINPKNIFEKATEILPGIFHYWQYWSICLSPTGFYVWSDFATLEFHNNSNGWFRAYINGQLYTMYSCGSVESGKTNPLEFLTEFNRVIDKLFCFDHRAVLSNPGSISFDINNWSLTSSDKLEVHIQNSGNPHQKTILSVKINGFLHEFDNGSKHSFTSKRQVIPKFPSGLGRATIVEDNKTVIGRLAYSIHEKYFKTIRIQSRPTMVKLENVVMQFNRSHKEQCSDEVLKNALYDLTEVLIDTDVVTVYEWQSSGLVPALLLLLDQKKKHIQLFKQCFEEKSTNENNMFALLVQKLIAVLENTERLPVYLYATITNTSIGLAAFRKSFSIILERGPGEVNLIDRTNNSFATEPSSTVKELEEFLLMMVTKWNSSEASGELNDAESNVSNSEVGSGSDAVAESADVSESDAVSEWVVVSRSDVIQGSEVGSEVVSTDAPPSEPEVITESAIVSVRSETSSGLKSPTVSRAKEIVDLLPGALKSDAVPIASGSGVVQESVVASGSGPKLVKSPVTSRSEETPALDLSAVPESGSDSVPDLAVASEGVVDLNTPASGSGAISESIVASGSRDLNSPTSKPSKKKSQITMPERILTTDEASGVPLESRVEHTETNSSNEDDDSESSSNKEVKPKDKTEETHDNNQSVSSESEIKWNPQVVLRSEFPALLPSFDPRPGQINFNPTRDFAILPPDIEEFTISPKRESQYKRKLQLTMQIYSKYTDHSSIQVELCNGNQTLFNAIQELNKLCKHTERLWSNDYKIVYRKLKNDDSSPKPSSSAPKSKIEEILQLLRILFTITTSKMTSSTLALTSDQFISKKISNKLMRQMKDALVVSCSGTPTWCEELMHSSSFLFPFETRQIYFQSTAFGTTRTLIWFQAQHDGGQERTSNDRSAATPERRLNNVEIGRLITERIRVPREDNFLAWAMQVMKTHCDRKARLEIQFMDEEGTGLGPTLEFYALAAAELQRRDLAMWICDDNDDESDENVGEGTKAPGYYVKTQFGLFPAPLPQDSLICDQAVKYFWFLGVILAKVLLDNRLIDLPLSKSFLKLMCHRNPTAPWYRGALKLQDLYDIDPIRGQFLTEIQKLVKEKTEILQDASLSSDSKTSLIGNLKVNHMSGPILLKDLALNFTYAPSSKIFGVSAMELVPNGADVEVTVDNIDEYYDLTLSFALEKGIARQLEAFQQGFSEVFLMENLAVFSPNELRIMLCGDQNPQWTKEDLINYTEPKLGYTKESPGFLRFVNVLMDISPEEKKSFLQFVTGCSSLPPGGLANLHPRLTVVKKIDAGDGSYPSVNTCVHYLKLPEYSTEEILKEKLLIAMKEKGFHFN